ncbi:hypothetical protein AA637_13885 [Cyanobacterium sp. HL-69]|uniref:hypothetical protein n=1 Tax=Cyanobacterium sp. HL-69 TaxID=2054282 RepID=UPI000CA3AA3A|nr:hypothetical protein AA637_13885 [Cyanobacterium sp. HL-69]
MGVAYFGDKTSLNYSKYIILELLLSLLLPIAYSPLPIAHCLFPIAHCPLPIAHCPFPS